MIQACAVYLLKVIVVSAILFGYYWLALRNKQFHYYNRFYLLAAVALSALLPLVSLNWFVLHSDNDNAIALLNVVTVNGGEDVVAANGNGFINWQFIATCIFACVAIFLMIVFIAGIKKIYRLKKQYPVTTIEAYDFVNTDLQQAPFSFFKNLFWRTDLEVNSATGKQMLKHELTHITQKHSWDKVFMQVMIALFWLNPFYWLMRRELYLVHEFIADEKAVADKDAVSFAAMLLATQYRLHAFAPAQQFHYSPIKRRLIMLTNSKKTSYNYLRRLLTLPLLAAILMLFAFKLQKNETAVAYTAPEKNFTVVIDAGHGGKDYGAYGLNNMYEKDIVLQIAKKVKELSASYNINVILSRDEDVFMTVVDKANFANDAKANAFVSLHANTKNNDEKFSSGLEIFVSDRNGQFDKCRELGSAISQSLRKDFSMHEPLSQRQKGIWVLSATQMPAVLIECGFLSNKTDVAILTDATKQELMAKKILEGIAAYANNTGKEQASISNATQNELAMDAGNADTAKQEPLYIVDGKETPAKEANAIDPKIITSIYIVKDPDATRKYGEKGKNGVVEITTKNASVSDHVQIQAKFPGGYESWKKHLQKDLKVSTPVDNGAVTGTYTVIVSFTVDKEGNVFDVKADNDPGYGTAKEAVRFIKEGPKWIPAVNDGRNVAYRQRQTITFQVSEG